MPFTRVAEMRIREAIQEGVFDDLPNAGQPLDLEEYFATPEDVRMAHSILKSADCVPTEVELMNDVARLERALGLAADGETRASTQQALNDRRLQLAMLLERRARRTPSR